VKKTVFAIIIILIFGFSFHAFAQEREQEETLEETTQEPPDAAEPDMYDNYRETFQRYKKRLQELEAERFRPEDTAELFVKIDGTESIFRFGNHEQSRNAAELLIKELAACYESLEAQLNLVNILQQDTELYLDTAEEVQAYIWANKELENTMRLYTKGLEAYRLYRLDESIHIFKLAKAYGKTAVRNSPIGRVQYQTEALGKEIEMDIEAASELTIITEDGSIIEPELKSDHVREDTGEQTLLDQAIELYTFGVEEQELNQYTMADEYFREAGRLLYKYKSMSIGKVRVAEVSSETTLWYIAGKELGTPLLWPLIWLYNQETVQDPDLIYPGDTIFIPAW